MPEASEVWEGAREAGGLLFTRGLYLKLNALPATHFLEVLKRSGAEGRSFNHIVVLLERG